MKITPIQKKGKEYPVGYNYVIIDNDKIIFESPKMVDAINYINNNNDLNWENREDRMLPFIGFNGNKGVYDVFLKKYLAKSEF